MADDKWVSDFGDLTGPETDKVYELLGISPADTERHAFSLACAVAVVTRQRTDPSVPDDRWKTLRMDDVVTVESPDPKDEADPTLPGSTPGSSSPRHGESAPESAGS
ncbi:hypothetical protein GCM10010329_50130 [Streptomyces spiroverticillatus]|uniref:Uncharacterized protein n=1 Tax=Streptomyces finlayi TaxID=67296 RepID=A0A918X1Q2_9ACTN|nr:hypothetical protein [Streptomyces finlayi]GHA20713.1 hypothetical protein GCM10010329_50130 [Streptomyces spiroverticillatus]GHD03384.1 hypothetical protein GCM10010334_51080 [Streptomyces finlayi]